MLVDRVRTPCPLEENCQMTACQEWFFEAWERQTYGGWEFTTEEYMQFLYLPYFKDSIIEGLNTSFPLKEFFDAAH